MIPTVLAILSGIFWTITYILIIRRATQDQIIGMPMVAPCMNIAWEFIFSFVFPSSKPQLYINYIWFFIDLIIVIQYLKLNQSEFMRHLPKQFFYPTFFSVLIVSFFNMLFATYEFGIVKGSYYTAFEDNLIMSMLFTHMLLSRNNVKGQSIYIAITKMIGTACASIVGFSLFPSSPLLNFLYLAILIFDGVYTVLLYRELREQGVLPWKRA
ncbi:MAG: hypothetical protein JO235_20410 [Chroococcidiopsidaceae cyanobacterium CP_BM_RX_35]|nr:hypothetical protein [Chroococcidiopsidaceae cyanobacterium CP_BM_RX_35]